MAVTPKDFIIGQGSSEARQKEGLASIKGSFSQKPVLVGMSQESSIQHFQTPETSAVRRMNQNNLEISLPKPKPMQTAVASGNQSRKLTEPTVAYSEKQSSSAVLANRA